MKKLTLLLLFFVFSTMILSAQVARQGFDDNDKDDWEYVSNISFYSMNNDTDLWKEHAGSNGRIDGAYSGPTYLAGRDLDNPHSESVLNNLSPEHILNFTPIEISGLEAEMTFWYNYVNIDKNDYIYIEFAYDNGTSWASPDAHIDIFATNQGGKFSTNGWEKVEFTVPSGNSYVRMRLVVYQNGNEYLGFDSFELKTSTLSADQNIIAGFSYGPNPSKDLVYLNATTSIDEVKLYNTLGKLVLVKKVNHKKMTLDLTPLSNGLYFAKVKSQDKFQTIKLIKK